MKRLLDYGFVYVLWCPYLPLWLKFGYTTKPDKRHLQVGKSLTQKMGIPVRLIKMPFPLPWARFAERFLLRTWAKARLKTNVVPESSGYTEWANCTGALVSAVVFCAFLFKGRPLGHSLEVAALVVGVGFCVPLDAVLALALMFVVQWGAVLLIAYGLFTALAQVLQLL